MQSISTPLLVVAAAITSMLFSSCTFNPFTHRNISAVGASRTMKAGIPANTYAIAPIPGGDIVLQRVAQHSNIHLMRLDDSLKVAAEYFSPYGRFQQQPLGIFHRDNQLYVLSADYIDDDTMSVILRRMDTKTLKEQDVQTLLKLPREIKPYERTEFAVAFSPDSSKALVYAFDLNMIQDLPAMLDAVYIDFRTLRHDTMRLLAPVSPAIKAAGYATYVPRQVVYNVHVTSDDRAYFLYHCKPDSAFITCYNIPGKTFTNSSGSLPGAQCDRDDYWYCAARSFLGSDNNLYVAALDFEEKKVGGMVIAKFNGGNPDALFARRIPLSPSLEKSITSLRNGIGFTIVDLAANPVTGGGTVLIQPHGPTRHSTSMSSRTNYTVEDVFHNYGDVVGVAFDGRGEHAWENILATNSISVYDHIGPYIGSRLSGDSLEVFYAGRSSDTTNVSTVTVMKVSLRSGQVGSRRPLVQYQGNIYFDLRRSYTLGAGHYLWYSNVGGSNSPELMRAR